MADEYHIHAANFNLSRGEGMYDVTIPIRQSTGDRMITLLISCPDKPGIVAAVSRFIFEHQGNILASDQHSTNQQDCTFFMRVNFAEEGFTLTPSELKATFAPIADAFHMQWSVH